MYTTESCTTSIAVSDYKKRYIDIPTFTEYCKACPNYDRLWSCPSYTFDVEAFWNQFQTLDLFAVKIIYNDNYAGKQFSEHKIADIMRQSLNVEKARMSQALFRLEEKFPAPSVFQPAPAACAMTIVHAPTACHAVIPTNSVIPSNRLAAMSV